MAYCKFCGSQIPSDSAFCPKCGAKAEDSGTAPGMDFGAKGGASVPPGPGSYKAPIRERKIALCIILSIVTCGIYGLVWFFNLVNDLNTAAPSSDDKTPGTVLLLSIVTCGIYSFVWLYKSGDKVDRIRTHNGEAPSSSAVLYLVLGLVGFSIISYCLIQTELNKVAQIPA